MGQNRMMALQPVRVAVFSQDSAPPAHMNSSHMD